MKKWSSKLPMIKLPVNSLKIRKKLIRNRGPFKRATTRSGKIFHGKQASKKFKNIIIKK